MDFHERQCQRIPVGKKVGIWLLHISTSHSAVIPTDSYRPPDRPQVVNWEENALIDFDDLCNNYNSLQIFDTNQLFWETYQIVEITTINIFRMGNHKGLGRLGTL